MPFVLQQGGQLGEPLKICNARIGNAPVALTRLVPYAGPKRLVGVKTLSPGSESRLKVIEVLKAMEAGAFEGGLCHDGGGSSEGRDPRGHRSHPSTLVQRLR